MSRGAKPRTAPGGHSAARAGAVILAIALGAPALAQRNRPEADAAVEDYLQRRQLRTLLAEHLGARLKSATQEERAGIADRLGKLYVELLGAAATDAERVQWEQRAEELVRLVPDIRSLDLRLNVARTKYAQAEDTAERWRLRLPVGGGEQERAEAERKLRELKVQFESVAAEAARRATQLEKQEETGRSSDKLSEEIRDANRLKLVSFYYAGWTNYYLGLLVRGTGQGNPEPFATDALKCFGWILSTGEGRTPGIERLNRAQLKNADVARTAIGTALALGLKGSDIEALRWLDLVEEEPDAPPAVRATVLGRRVGVLAAAKRWADLERVVRLARRVGPEGRPLGGGAAVPLDGTVARLLAVLCFESDRAVSGETIEAIGQVAMQDLVAKGQIGHILDLARRYGTTPLGDKGFIVHYVRGVQQYERAVRLQEGEAVGAGPTALDEPATTAPVINAYREAARGLDGATVQEDAKQFPAERGRALVMAGRSLFKAGDFSAAAERFSEGAKLAADPRQGEEALWLAVVSLDRAMRSGVSDVSDRLDELGVLYLRTYPQTENAAALLVKRASRGGLPDEEAVKVLLGVERDSPVWESSRRQAAAILFRRFVSAPEKDKAFASGRFVKVAEELLAVDRRAATDSTNTDKAAQQAAVERVVFGCRQLLDALLSVPTPDLQRAEGVFAAMQAVLNVSGGVTTSYEAEFTYRRLQMALAREDGAASTAAIERLRSLTGAERFIDSAERLLYQRANDRYNKLAAEPGIRPEQMVEAARTLMLHGERVVRQVGSSPAALSNPAVLTVHRTVARAAVDVFKFAADNEARDLAMRLDRLVLAAAPNAADSLLRLAEMAEAGGDTETALDCWKRLGAGLAEDSPEWFRARYETARLLAQRDPAKAAQMLQQHKVLYPDYGPAPYGEKLRALHTQVGGGG